MAFLFPRVAYAPVHCQRRAPRYNAAIPPFFNLIDEALSEVAKAAHQQQRETRRVINPRFDVRETEEGYQVDAELPGIDQEDIEIEFADEQTLVIRGRTGRPTEQSELTAAAPAAEATQAAEEKQADENADEVTLAAASESETSSVKSHQATVEDDFEDLGHDSDVASTSAQSVEKGKARATEQEVTEKPQEEVAQGPVEQQQEQHRRWISERRFGSFERTFKFPVRIHADTVTASLKNGVLSIIMYKAPVPETRRIYVA